MIAISDAFQHEFLVRALFGAALAGALNGYLGTWIVLRGWSLATDALAHALFPGVAAAAVLVGMNPAALLFGAALSALIIGGGAQLLTHSSRLKPDVALGILYPIGYALGILVVSLGKLRFELAHWLFGNIFGLAAADLWMLWGAATLLVPLFIALERPLLLATFDPVVARTCRVPVRLLGALFAAALVGAASVSFQAAGVIPMVALMIAPAATMRLLTDRVSMMLWGGTALGIGGAVGGVLLAFALNLSGAATIALLLGAIFLATLVFAPTHGVLARRPCENLVRRILPPLAPPATPRARQRPGARQTAPTRSHPTDP